MPSSTADRIGPQRVVVHFLQLRQPLERGIVPTAPCHFPCRTNPSAIGLDPQTDQQLRIQRRPPAFLRTALHGSIKRTQVQPPYQDSNGSRRMVFVDEFLHIHGPPTHLLSVHVANQRLPAGHIFLAHAASLRQTFYFARRKFRGFLHSFNSYIRFNKARARWLRHAPNRIEQWAKADRQNRD
jgi:hypothetical protein